MQLQIGNIVTVSGEIVEGPSGYMLYRGEDLDSVYLLPNPEGKPQETERRIADFANQNVGKKFSITGKLHFYHQPLQNKFPEESVVLPDDFFYIIWDAPNTVISSSAIQ